MPWGGTQALTFDGPKQGGRTKWLVDEEAAGGHYSELTALKGVPFLVSNTGCRGVFGDHLLVSDGENWSYVESLHESNYPAVRVNRDGGVSDEDLQNAQKYWQGYAAPREAFKRPAAPPTRTHL